MKASSNSSTSSTKSRQKSYLGAHQTGNSSDEHHIQVYTSFQSQPRSIKARNLINKSNNGSNKGDFLNYCSLNAVLLALGFASFIPNFLSASTSSNTSTTTTTTTTSASRCSSSSSSSSSTSSGSEQRETSYGAVGLLLRKFLEVYSSDGVLSDLTIYSLLVELFPIDVAPVYESWMERVPQLDLESEHWIYHVYPVENLETGVPTLQIVADLFRNKCSFEVAGVLLNKLKEEKDKFADSFTVQGTRTTTCSNGCSRPESTEVTDELALMVNMKLGLNDSLISAISMSEGLAKHASIDGYCEFCKSQFLVTQKFQVGKVLVLKVNREFYDTFIPRASDLVQQVPSGPQKRSTRSNFTEARNFASNETHVKINHKEFDFPLKLAPMDLPPHIIIEGDMTLAATVNFTGIASGDNDSHIFTCVRQDVRDDSNKSFILLDDLKEVISIPNFPALRNERKKVAKSKVLSCNLFMSEMML